MKLNHKILLTLLVLPIVLPITVFGATVKSNQVKAGVVLGASTYNSEQEAISSVVAKLGTCSKATGDQKITCLTEVLLDLTKILLNRNTATNSTNLDSKNSKVLDSYTFSIDETHKYFITTLYYGKNGYSKNATIEFKKDGDSKYVILENTERRADSYVTVLVPIINTEKVSGTFRIRQEDGKYSNELRAVLGKSQNYAINDIMNPVAGSVWTAGDTQTIKWSTVNIPDNIIGKIYIMKSTEVMYEDIAKNTGSYVWNNNKSNGEYFVNPGVYTLKIVMNDAVAFSQPFTIKYKESSISPLSNKSLNITSPIAGDVWTYGDMKPFQWTTDGMSNGIVGYIDIFSTNGVKYRISNVKNSGNYLWQHVGIMTDGGAAVPPGVYAVAINMDGVEKIISNFTIKQRVGTPVVIDTYNTLESVDGQIKKYNLKITSGLNDNPATRWSLNFTCPSNVSQVLAKVAGDVCDGADYVLGDGDTEIYELNIPLIVTHTDFNTSYLKIFIKAITRGGVVGGYTTYFLPIISSMG